MKTFLKVGVLSSAVLLLAACDALDPDSNKNKFYYSNPTNSPITFKIDDKDYTIEPGISGSVKLSPGVHYLDNNKGNKSTFIVLEHNNGGILNPNNYMYYTLSEVYALKGQADRFMPAEYEVTINGHELEMPLRSSNAAVIDGNIFNCQFPLGKPFPEEINLYDKKSQGKITSKCFDKPELLQYFSTEYDEKFTPETKADENNDTVNTVFDYTVPTPQFKHADVQKEAEKLVSLLNQVKSSDNPNIYDKLWEEINQVTIDLSTIHGKYSANDTVEENKYYGEFFNQINQLQRFGLFIK
ncbi:hypothetical protein ACP179_04055 [Xenorhabdus stockiae]|uniref:hypothetical protein n=1 Tax=Xenorhabdus stockiae TaxID=351614 RepID=UPI003CF5D323